MDAGRDAMLLAYSGQVLSSLVQGHVHVPTPAPIIVKCVAVADLLYMFQLVVSSTTGRWFSQDVATTCLAALRIRTYFAPTISAQTQNRNCKYRQEQQQHMQSLPPDCTHLNEARLEQQILQRPPACLHAFPYLHSREWMSDDGGKGDLVFTDGHGLFAVVEVKYINLQSHNNRTQKRKKVKEQAQRYGQAFVRRNPGAVVVIAGTHTEESRDVIWVALEKQVLQRVSMLVAVSNDLDNRRHPRANQIAPITPCRQSERVLCPSTIKPSDEPTAQYYGTEQSGRQDVYGRKCSPCLLVIVLFCYWYFLCVMRVGF